MSSGNSRLNSETICELVDRYEEPLVRYAARLVGDPERARDVVQDTFLKLCRQPPEQFTDSVASWLYTVCRNRAFDVRRKESRMNPVDQATTAAINGREPEPPDALEQQETAASAVSLLNDLPENQREVIRLKIEHGLSYREIAEVTGMSISNVGYHLHTGLTAIRRRYARI